MKACIFIISILGLVADFARAAEPPQPCKPSPSERQLKWQELEIIGMVNYSTITYYGKEWGYGDEEAAKFNPTEFDARQIVKAAKDGGIRGLVIDAKHHGGFCLWPSKFNDNYSVRNCPWKNGKGDMLGELVKACRDEGLTVGIYLSPWDRNHKDYGKPEYLTYYKNQLREVLTNYGPIFEVWLDGANGGDGYYGGAREMRRVDQKNYYPIPEIFAIIRKLQPEAVIFSDMGPDARWNGNEIGVSSENCWATIDQLQWAGSNTKLLNTGRRGGDQWIPAEADFPLRGGWFWHPGQKPKTPAELLNRYFTSVGRNSMMDIGIAPDRRGLMCDEDANSLKEFKRRLDAIFTTNLAKSATVSASNVRGKDAKFAASNTIAGNKDSYWATDEDIATPELTLDFGKPVEFSVVSLREYLPLGHRVDDWALDVWKDGAWKEIASGTGIGSRRLWRGQPLTGEKVRLRIVKAAACPAIAELGIYLEPEWSRKEAGNALAQSVEKGMPKDGWKVVSASSEGEPAVNAIDGNSTTLWHTHTAEGRQPPPQEIVVDMGKKHELTGFLYLPRQDGGTVGNIDRYAFYLSEDGTNWGEAVAQGEFGNINANPVQQKVVFSKPVKGRYFKFVGLHSADSPCICVAELGVTGK